jgi:MerR family transcriptional regulator, copper efflux regulator
MAEEMAEGLLRIGELASLAGVSRRTVDFYTGLGLLRPTRSGGNFRLYQSADVQRIAAIRRLEAQGIRLDEIARLLSGGPPLGHTEGANPPEGPLPADPVALKGYLTSLDAQVQALRDLPEVADHGTRGVLTGLVARAQMLIATAVILSDELLPGTEFLPPL